MFDFSFVLGRHGWAKSHFTWEGGTTEFRTSYLTDPLAEMAAQARWIVDPVFRKKASWQDKAVFSDEPGELILELRWNEPVTEREITDGTHLGERTLLLSLAEWDEYAEPGGKPDIVHAVLELPARTYVDIVFRELHTLWSRFGVIDYRDRWMDFDFPLAHFAAIGQMLKQNLPERTLWIN